MTTPGLPWQRSEFSWCFRRYFEFSVKKLPRRKIRTMWPALAMNMVKGVRFWAKIIWQHCTYPAIPTEFQFDVIIYDAMLLAPVIYNMCTGVNASHVFLCDDLYRIRVGCGPPQVPDSSDNSCTARIASYE